MMHAPLFVLRTSSVRDVHSIYLPPTITHGWGGPVQGMAFRPGMTHAIPTCWLLPGPPPSEVSIVGTSTPPFQHGWVGPVPGMAYRPGMTHAIPTCCQQLLRRRTPLTLCGACWDKCDWLQLRPPLCKWGPWIQRNMKPHSTSALVGALIWRVVAIADPPVLKHWVCTSAVPS